MEMLPTKTLKKKITERRTYCCHSLCTSNSLDKENGVILMPFPKPCEEYEDSLSDSTKVHNTKICPQCSKCLRWIHLCKGTDSRLEELSDISWHTKICSKHFSNVMGATETDPDPYPAEIVNDEVQKPARPASKDRINLPMSSPEKRCRPTTSLEPTVQINNLTGIGPNTIIESRNEYSIAPCVRKNFEVVSFLTDQDFGRQTATEKTPFAATAATLRSLAHEMLDRNLHVEFDSEFLAISSKKNCLQLEKTCVINRNLEMKIFVLGKPIIDDCKFWKKYPKIWSQELDSHSFFKDLFENWNVCKSCTEEKFVCKVKRTTSKSISYEYDCKTDSVRSTECTLLTSDVVCFHCRKMVTFLRTKYQKQPSGACRKTRDLTREVARAKLRKSLINLTNLKTNNKRLSLKLQKFIKSGAKITNSDNYDFLNILVSDNNKTQSSDLAKIFFNEQIKAAKAKPSNGHRWHPLMIKWCLFLKSKSLTYSAARKFITLPSGKRLYELQPLSQAGAGFHRDVLDTIKKEVDTSGREEHLRYCALLLDEVKIQENLVYKSSTGELIGFVELINVDALINQIDTEASGTTATDQPLATHVLQLTVRGITSSMEAMYAYFPAQTLYATTLFLIVWQAIEYLEGADIRILAVVSDGSAANKSFYKMCNNNKTGIQWSTANIYVHEKRPLYFVCDIPYLLKSARNAFANSGSDKNPCVLWKNGKQIEWCHVIETFEAVLNPSFKTLNRNTNDHLHLSPTSLMGLKLADQVLSKRMAVAMTKLVGQEASETINFIEMFTKFFDVMNTRHLREGTFNRNPDLNPFTSPDDERLTWLNEDFLGYLEEWKNEVKERPGNFSAQDRNKMLLSKETHEGLFMTVKSITQIVKFMLGKGADFVLTKKFNQDLLNMNFSKQRGASGVNTHPSVSW